MRVSIAFYLVIGIALLGLSFFLRRSCAYRNTDILSHTVFVLSWPAGLYTEVYRGRMPLEEWLRAQACRGGGWLATMQVSD